MTGPSAVPAPPNQHAADDATIAEAGRILGAGGLVALPTETVYGLAADATNGRAVARIFEAKGRPRFNPLIVHVAEPDDAAEIAELDARVLRLARAAWPGPLTLVLAAKPDTLHPLVRAGLPTVAIRVPDHGVARRVLRAAGCPLAAPSANRSGAISPTRAEHVARGLGAAVDLILDGGPCPVGVESTIVDLSRPDRAVLLRPGGLARATIEAIVGPLSEPAERLGRAGTETDGGPPVTAPGQLASHYAPEKPVALDVTAPGTDDAYLAFGPAEPTGCAATLNLSPASDLIEAAANLFDHLHRLDAGPGARIAVAPIPKRGLGEAINDRLRRAAAPRKPSPA